MTLVYARDPVDPAAPRMHALVLGIGRFPHLDQAPAGDRPACADSARAVVDFLVRNADRFEAPLATIECLLSDPRNAPGADQLARTDPAHDPRAAEAVGHGIRQQVVQACDDWIDRAQEKDVLFLYCSSHGLAERDLRCFLVCEDYNERPTNKARYLLNIGSIALALPAAKRAGAVWIFVDACQEVLEELVQTVGGVSGIEPVQAGVDQVTSWPVRSMAVGAAGFGQFAYAPIAGGLAYFTEALLHGLEHCCVEAHAGEWHITTRQLMLTLHDVAFARHARVINSSLLSNPSCNQRLMRVDDPRIPVAISTRPEAVMASAQQVDIWPRRNGGLVLATKADAASTWRCELSLEERQLEVRLDFAQDPQKTRSFDLDPPAVRVEVT